MRLVRGGVKVYRGGAGAARAYLSAERSRADDYYLSQGTGFAQRYVATGDGHVMSAGTLSGDGYESWVAGMDPDTGQPRGRVRRDVRAVRFVEVVVNGPKSWSLAAELHPDIGVAYENAQDRAAAEIVRWVGQHVTSRVGPRGLQVATPVAVIEAVSVRHFTSRAGDPHRHLHLQINARVQTGDGRWRGVDTVAVRDSIGAINGIGHATVSTDPGFRAALAAHGFTLDAGGEIEQLAAFVGPFSRRAAQIAAQVEKYEREWRDAHPNAVPGAGLRRVWDGRAWAEDRPDKGVPVSAEAARGRWLGELTRLGYANPGQQVGLVGIGVGQVDRQAVAVEVVARLGAKRSAWNHPDIRGEVEQLLARVGLIAEPAARAELAEDLVGLAITECVPLLERADVPRHIRAWTSPAVQHVADELAGRFAVRAAQPGHETSVDRVMVAARAVGVALDPCQIAAVAALTGDHALVVIHGAAGAGKTTTLTATKKLIQAQGGRLVVVTPTLKAARVAARELGTGTGAGAGGGEAGSVAWLVWQHGWRWNDTGTWTRINPGNTDPTTGRTFAGPDVSARLSSADLVVVDEAGMVDQDTARALLTVVDEAGARLALIGDEHQLPAVGRGGVLQLADRWCERTVLLDAVHRFTTAREIAPGVEATVPDTDYAKLTLMMRQGADPDAVFGQLSTRHQVCIYASEAQRSDAVAVTAAQAYAASRRTVVVVDTNDHARHVSHAIRHHLITAGVVDDERAVVTVVGDRVGVGDLIATRRNDKTLGVANRDTWTIATVHPDGSLTVTGATGQVGRRELPVNYVAEHVELAYATTAYGVQGDTVGSAHLLLGEHTSAASMYVGMTRGRSSNTVHLVAPDEENAQQQWADATNRGRPDLGPDDAHSAAQTAADHYTQPQPRPEVAVVVEALRTAWAQQRTIQRVVRSSGYAIERIQTDHARDMAAENLLVPLRTEADRLASEAAEANGRMAVSNTAVSHQTDVYGAVLRAEWDVDRISAAEAARTVAAGRGMFGVHRGRVHQAETQLQQWAGKWGEAIHGPDDHSVNSGVDGGVGDSVGDRVYQLGVGTYRINTALTEHARRVVEAANPEHAGLTESAREMARQATTAKGKLIETARRHRINPNDEHGWAGVIRNEQTKIDNGRQALAVLDHRISELEANPMFTGHTGTQLLTDARRQWEHDHQTQEAAAKAAQWRHQPEQNQPVPTRVDPHQPAPQRRPSRGI